MVENLSYKVAMRSLILSCSTVVIQVILGM